MNLGDTPKLTAADNLTHLADRRIEAARMRYHKLYPISLRRSDHPIAIFQGQSHGLFEHHMLAML